MHEPIPPETLEHLARSFFVRGQAYGFSFDDYVRFVNVLLDVAIDTHEGGRREAPEGALPLRGETVHIRDLQADDHALFHRWLHDPDGRHFLLSRSTGHHIDVARLLDDPGHVLGVVTRSDGTPIGAVAFLEFDDVGHKAELRKIIGEPEARGQGFGTEAARMWVSFGVRALKLQKIYLYTLASNATNIKLNRQLGFKEEGVLRQEAYFDGQYHDLLRMALVHLEADRPEDRLS